MSDAPTARLFVALDIPAAVRLRLAAWAREAAAAMRGEGEGRPLRLLDADSLHMTLCFLGSRAVEEIETIAAGLQDSAGAVGELAAGPPEWLPRRRPRALAVSIREEGDGLTRLHRHLSRAIAARIAWEPPRGRLRAHVTVARTRGGRHGRRPPTGLILPATPAVSFIPESVTLYRSWLSPAGATYEPLAVRHLAPAAM